MFENRNERSLFQTNDFYRHQENNDDILEKWPKLIDKYINIKLIQDNLDVDGNLIIDGSAILTGIATVGTGLVPDADGDAYLGTSSKAFSEAHINNIRLGSSSNGEIPNKSKCLYPLLHKKSCN